MTQEKLSKKAVYKVHVKFLIFISKSKVLLKLFQNVLDTGGDELFSQSFDSGDWKLLFKNMNEIVC